MTTTITVYSKPSCVQCDATTRALDRAGVPYRVVDLTADDAALELVLGLGHRAAPVVIVTDAAGRIADHWAGFRPDRLPGRAAA